MDVRIKSFVIAGFKIGNIIKNYFTNSEFGGIIL